MFLLWDAGDINEDFTDRLATRTRRIEGAEQVVFHSLDDRIRFFFSLRRD